jgi:RNA polymerase sigma factor (sigma-70 family)
MQNFCMGSRLERSKGYQSLKPIVDGAARRIFPKSVADPEDLVQEAFALIWRNCDQIRLSPKETMANFIRALTKNKVVDILRKTKRTVAGASIDEIEAEIAATEPLADSLVESAQNIVMMEDFLRTQPRNIRIAFAMTEQDGLTRAEAARLLNVNYQTLSTQMTKVRDMMTSAGIATWQKKGEIADKWREAGIDIEKLPRNPAQVIERNIRYVEIANFDSTADGLRRELQANGKATWLKGKTVPLESFIRSNANVEIKAISHEYYGWSLSLKAPADAVPSGDQFTVTEPFVLSPNTGSKLLDGNIQRMVVAGVRRVSDELFELDAYCLDEDLAAPTKNLPYSYGSASAQKMVSKPVRDALRLPVSEDVKSACVWEAVAGTKGPPGICR